LAASSVGGNGELSDSATQPTAAIPMTAAAKGSAKRKGTGFGWVEGANNTGSSDSCAMTFSDRSGE
jgi:hypothetical protein